MNLEFTEGMQFDKGYISPYMVTDQDRMEAVLEDPYILIANQKIGSVRGRAAGPRGCNPVRQAAPDHAEGRRGRSRSRRSSSNKLRGTFTGVAVKAPVFGEPPQADARDTPILTKAEVITEEMGLKLENTQVSQLGHALRSRPRRTRRRSSMAPVTRPRIRAASNQIKPRSRTPIRTSIARSSRSASRSCPVCRGRQGWRATETEMKEKSTASRTRSSHSCSPRGGTCRAAASRSCRRPRRSTSTRSRMTTRRPRADRAPGARGAAASDR